jgi:hypothetical protein
MLGEQEGKGTAMGIFIALAALNSLANCVFSGRFLEIRIAAIACVYFKAFLRSNRRPPYVEISSVRPSVSISLSVT